MQKGIQLAKTKGRPFDIRVMVQKTNQGKWVSTGLFTKIGRPGKVATNYNQGGLDVALDSKGKPWILEVNTRPQFYPLKNMKNRKLYQRMVTSGKQYGRTK